MTPGMTDKPITDEARDAVQRLLDVPTLGVDISELSTTYQLLQVCWDRADQRLKDAPQEPRGVASAQRELALAKTAIEEAQIRYARGVVLATRHGEPGHVVVDVSRPESERPA